MSAGSGNALKMSIEQPKTSHIMLPNLFMEDKKKHFDGNGLNSLSMFDANTLLKHGE